MSLVFDFATKVVAPVQAYCEIRTLRSTRACALAKASRFEHGLYTDGSVQNHANQNGHGSFETATVSSLPVEAGHLAEQVSVKLDIALAVCCRTAGRMSLQTAREPTCGSTSLATRERVTSLKTSLLDATRPASARIPRALGCCRIARQYCRGCTRPRCLGARFAFF